MIVKKGLYCLFLLLLITVGCSVQEEKENESQSVEKKEIISDKLVEDRRIYQYEYEPITHLYVTIVRNSSGEPYTFYDLNHWYDFNSRDTDGPALETIVQEGTEEGPGGGDILFEHNVPNSTIEIRGNSTRVAPQKSYKIKLMDSAGLWRGQKTLNLNKHPNDITRLRNKLSFDYYTLIPDIASLRTEFVHLHIKDLTGGESEPTFVDYGLFTHVEQVNERYLASRGFDSNGNLYKATNFEFHRYSEQFKLETDSSFDKSAFESILEIKGSRDHTKLLKMLDDVNDEAININEVVDTHFERDNYLTWVATNILFGNTDTISQNYYLYSPLNSNKWYFLPWDYDGAWGYYDDGSRRSGFLAPWQSGVGNYWSSVLHKRFFKDPANVQALNEKIEDLSKVINPSQTTDLLSKYVEIVKPFISRAPDVNFLPLRVEEFNSIVERLPQVTEKNKTDYYLNLEKPMPIFLGASPLADGSYEFRWEHSYDLQGDELTYHFELSKDPNFTTILTEEKGMIETTTTVKDLSPGRYYWRVTVWDSKNNKQIAFDKYENEDGEVFHGTRQLIVR